MSREQKVTSPGDLVAADPAFTNNHTFEINLRLNLDEVAEVEAAELRRNRPKAPTRKELCRLACRIYDARRARNKLLNGKLFGEPAWDMLLALYCLPARGYRLSVTGLTHASEVTGATGLRWQSTLEKEGLIERGPPEVDARRKLIRLTPTGRAILENYLTRLYYCDTPVPPHPEVHDD